MLSQNHFQLLGLTATFSIDDAELVGRYRELQNTVHPDRFANATDQERRISMQHAAQINEAFNTLKDPLRRAAYLLRLAGIDVDTQGSAMDTAFLMEQMEVRERLLELRTAADPLAEVSALIGSLNRKLNEMTAELAVQFAQDASDALPQACDNVRKMQFLYKLRDEANALEADLEDELL